MTILLISPDVATRVLKSLHTTKFAVTRFSTENLGLLADVLDLNETSVEVANYVEQSMKYLTAIYDSPPMLTKLKRCTALINAIAEEVGAQNKDEEEFYFTLHSKLAERGIILNSRFKVVKHDGQEHAFFYVLEVFTVTAFVDSQLSSLNLREIIYLVTPRTDRTLRAASDHAVSSTHDSIFCNVERVQENFQKFSDRVRYLTHFDNPETMFPTIFDVCSIPLDMLLFATACRLAPTLINRSMEQYLDSELKMSVLYYHLRKTRPELINFDFEVPFLLLAKTEGICEQELFQRLAIVLFREKRWYWNSNFIQILCKTLAKGFCQSTETSSLFDVQDNHLKWNQTRYGSSYSILDVYGEKIWKVVLLNIPFVSDNLVKTLVEQINRGLKPSKHIERFQMWTEPGWPMEPYIRIFEGSVECSELSEKLESASFALVDFVLSSLRGGEKVLGCRFDLEPPIFTDGLTNSVWDVVEVTAVNLTNSYEFVLCLTTLDHPCWWEEVMSIQVSFKSSGPAILSIGSRANSIWSNLSNLITLLEDLVDQITACETNKIQAETVKQFLRVCLEIIARVRHRPKAV